MKKLLLIVMMIFVTLLTGCQKQQENQTESIVNNTERYAAYQRILTDFYYDKTEFNETLYGTGYTLNFSENKFAILDIDKDGRDELLISYETDSMAGMVAYVYGFQDESGEAYEKLVEFPFLSFYDNGIIQAGWSHNQGYAGESFWPYNLYQYDLETEKYERVAYVDAWDKSYQDTNWEGTSFPDELDKDEDGFIYYVHEGESEVVMDKEEYETWLEGYLKDATEITIPYKNYTIENVNQITQ